MAKLKEPDAAKGKKAAVPDAEAEAAARIDRLFGADTGRQADRRVISVRGAREHNLKNVDLTIPRDKLVVFTGLSGSGKSSLAFDTIYAEGQRRYVESPLGLRAAVSGDASQKPDVDEIDGLAPGHFAIKQKNDHRAIRARRSRTGDGNLRLHAAAVCALSERCIASTATGWCRANSRRSARWSDRVLALSEEDAALPASRLSFQWHARASIAGERAGQFQARRVSAGVEDRRRCFHGLAHDAPCARQARLKHDLRSAGFNRLVSARSGSSRFSTPESLLDLDFTLPSICAGRSHRA